MEERSEAKNKIEKETDEGKRNKLRHTMETYQELLDNKYIINAYITDDRIVEKVLSGEKDIKNIVLLNLQAGDCEYYEEYGEKLEAKLTFFEEVMDKLIDWEYYDELPKTKGLLNLLECYEHGKFPGLGIIKRYSLMHHIQMIGDYLEGK